MSTIPNKDLCEALKIVLEMAEITYAEWSLDEDMEKESLALGLMQDYLEELRSNEKI